MLLPEARLFGRDQEIQLLNTSCQRKRRWRSLPGRPWSRKRLLLEILDLVAAWLWSFPCTNNRWARQVKDLWEIVLPKHFFDVNPPFGLPWSSGTLTKRSHITWKLSNIKWLQVIYHISLTYHLALQLKKLKHIFLKNVYHCTMQQGLPFEEKKSYHEMLNFENWFLCQFSSNTRFSFGGGSLNTPKIGKRKKEFTNINLRGFKTQKTWRGCFSWIKRVSKFLYYICYNISFHNLCEKHPLMGKKRF